MNDYEDRLEARRQRLKARADKAAERSAQRFSASRKAVEDIPFGQPILVGHHSEARHRGALRKQERNMRAAIAEDEKAAHYARKAAAVGTGGISSDDPEAIDKLRKQLADGRTAHEKMKAVNAVIRSKKSADEKTAAIVALGFSQEQAVDIQKPDFCGRVGFPPYALSNNTGNLRRLEIRIKELEEVADRGSREIVGANYRYREDADDNRAMFFFDDKPDEETRKMLKRWAFKWSPSREGKPWVRKITGNALGAAQIVRKWLDERASNAKSDK